MKRGRILDAFVVETLGVLLVLWMLGVTFFFKQIPNPNGETVADATMQSPESTSEKSFLGTELSEVERREFTEQQLTLFGNAAKTLLKQVGKDAVNHVIQQVTATEQVADPTATQSILEELKQFQSWSKQGEPTSAPLGQPQNNQAPNSVWNWSNSVNTQYQSATPPVPQPAQQQPAQRQPQRTYNSQPFQPRPVPQQYFKPSSQPQPVVQQPAYQNHPYQQPVYQQPIGKPTYQQHEHPVYEQPIQSQGHTYYR